MSSGTRTFRLCRWPRGSGSNSCSATRRQCPTRCICTGTSFRWSTSTAFAFRRGARYGAGSARGPGRGRLRRQQSRLVGAPLPPALSPRRRHVHDDPLRLNRADGWRTAWLCAILMPAASESARRERHAQCLYRATSQRAPRRRTPIEDYVVEDHKDHVLKTFKTQKEAIDWAKKEGHHPLVARVRHENNKTKLDHWRSAGRANGSPAAQSGARACTRAPG